MKKIAIVQRHVTNYRINFYNLLYQELYNNNIELTLFAGKTGSTKENEYLKSGIEYLDFGKEIKNYSLFKTLYWQNVRAKNRLQNTNRCEFGVLSFLENIC